MIEVRRTLHTDIPFILEELREFSNFFASKYPLFPRDEAKAHAIVSNMVENHLFFTSTNDGELSGFIAGWVTVHPFNPELIQLAEAFWWVKAEFRSTRAGSKLLDAFVEWGRDGAQWITMTLESNSPVSCDPLLKRGFQHKETSFIMEI